jgi:hypothetical protein
MLFQSNLMSLKLSYSSRCSGSDNGQQHTSQNEYLQKLSSRFLTSFLHSPSSELHQHMILVPVRSCCEGSLFFHLHCPKESKGPLPLSSPSLLDKVPEENKEANGTLRVYKQRIYTALSNPQSPPPPLTKPVKIEWQ